MGRREMPESQIRVTQSLLPSSSTASDRDVPHKHTPVSAAAVAAPPPPLSSPCLCPCTSSPFASSRSLHPPFLPEFPCYDEGLKRLVLRISSLLSAFPQNAVPEFPSKLRHDLLDELVQKFCCHAHCDFHPLLCPGLQRWIEALAGKPSIGCRVVPNSSGRPAILDTCSSSLAEVAVASTTLFSKKRKIDALSILSWVKDIAVDPTKEDIQDAKWWKKQVLEARRCLFVKLNEDIKKRDFSVKELKKKCKKVVLSGALNQPTRRSERIANNAYRNIHYLQTLKKRIGVGPTFQADLPDWRGPSNGSSISDYKEDPDTLRWLGTQVWPVEADSKKTSYTNIGKRMSNNCGCYSPGSVICIRSHVNLSSLKLKADLGQAFNDWGFDRMGEEVSKLWNLEDQLRFNALESLNTESEFQSFWEVATKYFSSKSKQDIVSYYFNVFSLRRISNLSRLAPETFDSEEDDDGENQDDRKDESVYHVESRSRISKSVSGVRSKNI